MAWGVVVRGLAHVTLGGCLGELLGLLQVGAEKRGHGPFAHGHRRLHRPPTGLQEPRRVGKAERAGCGKRGIFAKGVPSHIGGRFSERHAFGIAQDPHRRHGDRHQGRLSVLGQRQIGFRAFPHQM